MHLAQNTTETRGAAGIAARVEGAIDRGELGPGARLPAIRELAAELAVSPATVAAAYRLLRERGLVSAHGRLGTVVAQQPPLRVRPRRSLPAGARDLASGNPDPALLPPLAPAVAKLDTRHKLYGGEMKLPRLVELARDDFAADRVRGEVAIVSGALDGIERVLQAHLRLGDAVAVEDPSWPRIADLVNALGLRVAPVAVDVRGMVPGDLERALAAGARAVVVTPRGQNPTGAALDARRAKELKGVLAGHPKTIVVEDDYVAAIAGAPYRSVHDASERWVVIRSLSKVLGPDLRMATMAGDGHTIGRVEGRQVLGAGWVSHVLQQVTAQVWAAAATRRLLARAEREYARRRRALIEALAAQGIEAWGDSGLGVWVPVREEGAVVQALAARGWALSPGERYRFRSPPGIRVTTAALPVSDAPALAADFAGALARGDATYAG